MSNDGIYLKPFNEKELELFQKKFGLANFNLLVDLYNYQLQSLKENYYLKYCIVLTSSQIITSYNFVPPFEIYHEMNAIFLLKLTNYYL